MPGKSLSVALQVPLAQVQQAIHAARQGQESFIGLLAQRLADARADGVDRLDDEGAAGAAGGDRQPPALPARGCHRR